MKTGENQLVEEYFFKIIPKLKNTKKVMIKKILKMISCFKKMTKSGSKGTVKYSSNKIANPALLTTLMEKYHSNIMKTPPHYPIKMTGQTFLSKFCTLSWSS